MRRFVTPAFSPLRRPRSLRPTAAVWPDGQRVILPGMPSVIARVVDTGGHFRGLNKVVRVAGHEPLDVCVDTPQSRERYLPEIGVVEIVPGDNFEGGRAVASGRTAPGSVA